MSLLWECAEEIIARKLSSLSSLKHVISKDIPPPFSFSRFLASIADASTLINQQLFEMADPGELSAIGALVLQKQRYTFLWDVKSGIPFAWEADPSEASFSIALERLLSRIPPDRIRFLIGGPEYDCDSEQIWEKWRIRPVIPLATESGKKTAYKNAVYDDRGEVYCPGATMVFGGFEEKRESLKFLCPAKHYGYKCKDLGHCLLEKNIRIPLKENPRVFMPLPRSSYRWQNLWSLYKKRETVESILLSRIPRAGKGGAFLRIASLLFAAAYRTKKRSKRTLIRSRNSLSQ